MIAIIDCNSFYCSCERLFRPDLSNKPVVVLSNNDGCIISRTDEAKALGIGMAGPYFTNKPLIEKHGVATFSSNYNLYGDLSWRVMETLRILIGKQHVEVYSVDEAFLFLDFVKPQELESFTLHIKNVVEMWTGIKVSIGVAPTKVLSKLANKLAKKNKIATNCIWILDTPQKIADALRATKIEDVWGIGSQYAEKLKKYHILNALDLSFKTTTWAHQHLGGVVGARLVRELKGISSISMKDELINKKMIATTRMFGEAVNTLQPIKEAVATYASRAAEKLRRQYAAASYIGVFLVAKQNDYNATYKRGNTISSYTILPQATSQTQHFIKAAVTLAERMYVPGTTYKKAGVTLSNIVPDNAIQGNLFAAPQENNNRLLMDVIDSINASQRNDILKFAASGTNRDWKMRQELRSPKYTTRWEDLLELK